MRRWPTPHCSDRMLSALKAGVARLSPQAYDMVSHFVTEKLSPLGGFTGRNREPDCYYSAFGYALAYCLGLPLSVNADGEWLSVTLQREGLDLIHTVSVIQTLLLLEAMDASTSTGRVGHLLSQSEMLKKSWKKAAGKRIQKTKSAVLERIEAYRTADGGFHHDRPGMAIGTAYGAFIVLSLYDDLGLEVQNEARLRRSVLALECPDGSFTNDPGSHQGLVTATAAACIVLGRDRDFIPTKALDWIKARESRHGGLTAGLGTPIPDLLSTATGLLALSVFDPLPSTLSLKAGCMVDLHWDETGGFFGSVADPIPDIEYTYYALLILGLMGGIPNA